MKIFTEFKNAIKKTDKKSLREGILMWMEECIYSGYFPPGVRLIESELAEYLGISRTPIREAIIQLETKGLVKIISNKGAVVNTYSLSELEEINIIFKTLSGIAASLSVEFISGEELKRMEEYIARMEICKDNDSDRKEWFSLNDQFHKIFLKPCKKKLLLELIKQYKKQVGRYWYFSLTNRYLGLFSEGHRSIFEAFKLRNSEMVRINVEKHIQSYINTTIENLRSFEAIDLGRRKYSRIDTVFVSPPVFNHFSIDQRKVGE
jgi:DNA-binding GntR family transcriptional regulator